MIRTRVGGTILGSSTNSTTNGGCFKEVKDQNARKSVFLVLLLFSQRIFTLTKELLELSLIVISELKMNEKCCGMFSCHLGIWD